MILHLHEFAQALAIVAIDRAELEDKLTEVREKAKAVIEEYIRREKILCRN